MEKKRRNPALRPVAWIALIVLTSLMCIVAELLQRLGIFLVDLIMPLPGWTIFVLAVMFGGTYLGLIGYAANLLPMVVVTVTEWIYPTKRAVRYYVSCIYSILFYIVYMICYKNGLVIYKHGAFWLYALCIYDIILLVLTIVFARGTAKEKEEERKKELDAQLEEERKRSDEISELKEKLSGSEERNRIILEYSTKTCRELANVPENVEFDKNHWPISINGNSCTVYVDRENNVYHRADCDLRYTDDAVNIFNLPKGCLPCKQCQPIQVYGFPKWLGDYWNAIATKKKYGLLDPDILRKE